MPDLDEIWQRANAATPGPWTAHDREEGKPQGSYEIVTEVDPHGSIVELLPPGQWSSIGRREDAEFIAHAREDIPALLDEIKWLTEEREHQSRMVQQARRKALQWADEKRESKSRLDAVRALLDNHPVGSTAVAGIDPLFRRSDILHALNGEST